MNFQLVVLIVRSLNLNIIMRTQFSTIYTAYTQPQFFVGLHKNGREFSEYIYRAHSNVWPYVAFTHRNYMHVDIVTIYVHSHTHMSKCS